MQILLLILTLFWALRSACSLFVKTESIKSTNKRFQLAETRSSTSSKTGLTQKRDTEIIVPVPAKCHINPTPEIGGAAEQAIVSLKWEPGESLADWQRRHKEAEKIKQDRGHRIQHCSCDESVQYQDCSNPFCMYRTE